MKQKKYKAVNGSLFEKKMSVIAEQDISLKANERFKLMLSGNRNQPVKCKIIIITPVL